MASLGRANSSALSVEKQGESNNLCVAIKFAQITWEYHVPFFTGLPEPKELKGKFDRYNMGLAQSNL